MRLRLLVLCFAASSICLGQQSNGIFVGAPKVYDDSFLQQQLDATKSSLSIVNPIDQGKLIGALGATQGASLTQTAVAVQGGGPSTPSVVTTTPATGAASTATTQGSLAAAAPATPAASTMSMPSSMAQSSLDTLNEQMQLKYELTNLQLLLDGALSDRFLAGGKGYKKHITIGFPISLEAPAGKRYENALAEVTVTVCNPPARRAVGAEEVPLELVPSVITVLPREKTYNVASLTDKSFSFGAGGVIAGVFNVGGSFLSGHKTYYLIQQQDTIALQLPAGNDAACHGRGSTTFAWQFRPVLGQKRVRSGLRQTFVQIAFPSFPAGLEMDCSGTASIHTAWRRMDPKTGAVASEEISPVDSPTVYDIANFDTAPYTRALEVQDMGGGRIAVRVQGQFLPGVRARVGPFLMDATTPGFLASSELVQFVVSAEAIAAAGGAFLVGRDGHESPVEDPTQVKALAYGACPVSEATRMAANSKSEMHLFKNPDQPPQIGEVTPRPYSDTSSLLHIKLNQGGEIYPNGKNPLVVLIGDNLYGLSDAPFHSQTPEEITVVVPNEVLRANRTLQVQRLLWGSSFADRHPIGIGASVSDFAISKVAVLSKTRETLVLGIAGTALDGARVVLPDDPKHEIGVNPAAAPAFLVVTIPARMMEGVKEIVLRKFDGGGKPAGLPVAVSLSDDATKDVPAKVELKIQGVAPGAKQLQIQGSRLDQVAGVSFMGSSLNFRLSLDKSVLIVDGLPPAMTAQEGIVYLDIQLADKSTARCELKVKSSQHYGPA
ncbi:MAG: hypothetical protein P4M04_10910 [Acidobacteriota bacterium]|nr:hypothetical protein [Acidobacteriota bacterium]